MNKTFFFFFVQKISFPRIVLLKLCLLKNGDGRDKNLLIHLPILWKGKLKPKAGT